MGGEKRLHREEEEGGEGGSNLCTYVVIVRV